jgi:hypothetical protein
VAGTWGSLVREILETANKSSSTVAESDRVKRAIVEALELFRAENFLTLEVYWSVTLLSGQRNYSAQPNNPLAYPYAITPVNLTSIEGQTIDLDRGGNPNTRWELLEAPAEEFDVYNRYYNYISQPDYWMWFNQQLWLYPVPDLTGDIVRGRGVIDAGVPGMAWSGSAWSYTKPQIGLTTDGAAMTDDYPNPANGGGAGEYHFWIGDGGYQTLKWYVLYTLYQGVWQGRDGAISGALANYTEKMQALVKRHSRARQARQIQPWRGEGRF